MAGGRMLRVGLATAVGLLSCGLYAAAGQAAVLADQFPRAAVEVPTFPSFAGAQPVTNQIADDVTVPKGQVWKPQSADTLGLAVSGSDGAATGNVWIYGGGAAPGGQLFSQSGATLDGGTCDAPPPSGQPCNPTFRIAEAPKLKPGHYWISLQSQGSYAWWWAVTPPGEAFGSPAVWQNPGDGAGTGCTTYTPLIDCGAFITAEDGRDMIFRLNGDLIDSRFTFGAFESNGRRISLRATFPDPGKAKLKGKRINPVTKQVRAGVARLPVKLKRSAKRKLANGRRVKVVTTLSFTAKGGVPFKGKATVNVIPLRPGAAAPALRLVE